MKTISSHSSICGPVLKMLAGKHDLETCLGVYNAMLNLSLLTQRLPMKKYAHLNRSIDPDCPAKWMRRELPVYRWAKAESF